MVRSTQRLDWAVSCLAPRQPVAALRDQDSILIWCSRDRGPAYQGTTPWSFTKTPVAPPGPIMAHPSDDFGALLNGPVASVPIQIGSRIPGIDGIDPEARIGLRILD